MTQGEFADNLVSLGREHGFVLGMKRANEILRKHGIDVLHPAREEILAEMQNCNRASVMAYKDGAVSAALPRPSDR